MMPDQVERRPATGGAQITGEAIEHHHSPHDADAPTRVDPRNLVRDVRMLVLADALYGDEPFGYNDDDAGVRFLCPRCGHRDHNGGTARPIDAWSWHCWRCQFDGTRMTLEFEVLKSRVAVDRLFRLVNEGAR